MTPTAIIVHAKMKAFARKLRRLIQINGLYVKKITTPIDHIGMVTFGPSHTSKVDFKL